MITNRNKIEFLTEILKANCNEVSLKSYLSNKAIPTKERKNETISMHACLIVVEVLSFTFHN